MGIASRNSLHSTAGSGIDFKEIMEYLKFGDSDNSNKTRTISIDMQLGVKKYVKGQLKKHGDWFIHPVFSELQR